MASIGILQSKISIGGVERVAVNLIQGFVQKGHEVHLFLYYDEIKLSIPSEVKVHILGQYSPFLYKISQLRPRLYAHEINTIISDYKIDFFLSNSTHFSGMKTTDLIQINKKITVVHNTQSKRRFKRHKKDDFLKKLKLKRIQKSFINKNLICVSSGVKQDLLETLQANPKNITTIYNPFNFESIKSQAAVTNSKIPQEDYIIHVGRFELGHKRQDVLLKAFKQLNSDIKLVLLGDGADRKKIEALVQELELEHRVIMPGYDSNPYNWIKNAKLFVFSSDYEGLGMVLVEALILNVPVVSTDCPSGPNEILINDLSDYLVPPGNVDALARKIEEALNKYPAIKQDITERFQTETIVEQYIDFFDSV